MSPEVLLREMARIQIGDIHLQTTTSQTLVLHPGETEGEATGSGSPAIKLPERSPTAFCSEDRRRSNRKNPVILIVCTLLVHY